MRILIISRKAEEVRRSFQIRQMAALGLSFEFLDAFEATDLTAEECQTAASNWPSPTRRQDIACFLSHRNAWQAVIAHGAKVLILEDDAVLSDDIAAVLATIEARNDAWNSVYDLEFAPRRHILNRRPAWQDTAGRFGASRVYQNRVGLAGYIIGPEAARRMLAETTSYSLIDAHFWHRSWLAAYQIEPAPVIQQRFLEDEAESADFVRPEKDLVFLPLSKVRKVARRLELESIKARNLVVGLFLGQKRNVRVDRSRFKAGAVKSA
ncbi:glycosyltransferase family 25 protein [Rhizobium sp. WYJ-E13]|uniref:glycosyltransferase family 25 protein n=1 Tax=Rhizobium sp. WYJ-E13 TaxID=2849093 RepID=UPI001C1E9E47|nr:glycosyltransferase family 25 protein [Rhizobium sp. WYJ-E13]QWW69871.1 glycosyltransferase family 25 protein [Rhizobium sp. WYJ-E13]